MGVWSRVWLLVFLGYSVFGRSFAYIGFPSIKVFLGEVVLAGFFLLGPKSSLGRWIAWLVNRPGDFSLSLTGWAAVFHLFYGVLQVIRGIFLGNDPSLALQNLVFNVYPLYLSLGFSVALFAPQMLKRAVRVLSWVNGVYGLLYVLFLNRLEIFLPWAQEVRLFGQPMGSVIALLGLVVFEKRSTRFWILFLLNLFVLLAVQVRGDWLALAVVLATWVLIKGYFLRTIRVILALLLLFSFLYFTDLHLPGPKERGGEISVRGILARLVAPWNVDMAYALVGEEAYSFAGTVVGWRVPWWTRIWETVSADQKTLLLGLGYGFPLWSLYEEIPEGVRTPHNVLFYCLGYTGFIGLFFFFLFMGSLLFALYKRSKNSIAAELAFVVSLGSLGAAFFGNVLETPFGAIPFYLLAGFGLGASKVGSNYAYLRSTHPLPPKGR